MSTNKNEPPSFKAIWHCIKRWDIQRTPGAGYHGPTADDVRALLSALRDAKLELKSASWQPTHVHIRSGGMYRELMRGELEIDLAPVVIYDNAEGRVWVRPEPEFDDGRFMELPRAAT